MAGYVRPREMEAMKSTTVRSTTILIVSIVCITAFAVSAIAEVIELHSGVIVKGEVLRKRADRVVVDLGFTVIEIPMSEVSSIADSPTEIANGDEATELFRADAKQVELTVRENMGRCAEAVVQVRTPTGLGSGFLIHNDGYVVTNQHVVSGENRLAITVFKQSTNELEHVHFENVRIVAMAPIIDLALLKIENAEDFEFETVPLASPRKLHQGQPVFAVGSPLGLDRSVSQGIISLTNRLIANRVLVQTTTEINPGNSGGPLFNMRGEVVGVNDLKLAGVGLEGLGFAIPVNVLRDFLHDRNSYAFDPRNPNAGFRYNEPPRTIENGQ